MLSIQKLKCSWSLVAAVASILALVSVVHLFLFPLVPSLDYFSARQVQNSCGPVNGSFQRETGLVSTPPPVDLEHEFPADLHNAVVYRNAPWSAKIGRWLSGCDAITKEAKIVEVLTIWTCLVFYSLV